MFKWGFFRNINKILYWYRAPLLLWEYDQQILQSLALFVLESIFNICWSNGLVSLHTSTCLTSDDSSWSILTLVTFYEARCVCVGTWPAGRGMRITMITLITRITKIRKTSNLALVLAISTVWAPDQLGGGWGREDGGRGFGLGGHSTVDSMPQGPGLRLTLSSTTSLPEGWGVFSS